MRRLALALVLAVVGMTLAGCRVPAPAPSPSPSAACPSGQVPVDLRLPVPGQVRLMVLNGSGVPGKAKDVIAQLGQRGFQVLATTTDEPPVDEVALIRYGPRTVGAAQVVRAYFLDQAKPEFSINDRDDLVEIVLGTRFRELGTKTEVNQMMAQLGQPTAPPGTCAVDTINR
jgi:hypothetical protein